MVEAVRQVIPSLSSSASAFISTTVRASSSLPSHSLKYLSLDNMKFIVVAVIFAVCATCTHAVVYKDCGSKAKDLKMTISGCSDADPACPFVTGQNVTLQAEFTSGKTQSNFMVRKKGQLTCFCAQIYPLSQRQFSWLVSSAS